MTQPVVDSLSLFPAAPASLVAERLASLPTGPTSLLLGASTAGYQVEGGYNDRGQPANNWRRWELTGRAACTRRAADFWEQWPADLDRAQAMGLSAFRLGVEWARLERHPRRPGGRVLLDEPALQRYAAILAGCGERGLTPVVTLHHFTHPEAEGPGLWIDGERGPDRFVPYALHVAERLGELLQREHHQPPIPYFVTINEPFMLAAGTHLAGIFPGPPGARGAASARLALENLHLAHVRLYRGLHRLYRERGWAPPAVTLNPWASLSPEADLLLLHLLQAPANGVPQSRLAEHLRTERELFVEATGRLLQGRRTQAGWRGLIERSLQRVAAHALAPERFTRLRDEVYAGPADERLLDRIALDFYDPFYGNYAELGFPRLLRIRRAPWEWQQAPTALPGFLELYSRVGRGQLPVDLLEQGMAVRCPLGGQPAARPEGFRRGALLRAGLLACLEAQGRGVPLGGYFHWSLMDNWEWGSFEPRFGLHGVIYEDGARRLETDISGEPVGEVYRRISEALASGERDLLVTALADP